MQKIIKIFLVLLLFTSYSFAQIKIHKTISIDDGLVDNAVSCIHQDSKGFIWFGTYDGLSRWDGNNFVNYNTSSGLPHVAIFDIVEAEDSTIYFAIFGGGVLVYKDGIIDTINTDDGLNSNFTTELLLQKDGSLLIAVKGKLYSYKNGIISRWGEEYNFPKIIQITGMIETNDNTLYLATSNAGLIKIKNNVVKIIDTNNGLVDNKVLDIKLQNDNTLLIGTQNGISKLRNDKVTTLKNNGKPLDEYVYNIFCSKNGNTYYATTSGVILENKNGIAYLKELNGLKYISVMSILEDQNGTIYFGTDGGGVSIYYPEKFETYTNKYISPSTFVSSVYQDRSGMYYFATDNGVVIDDGKSVRTLTTKNGLSGDEIKYFFETSDNKIYISTYLHHLSYYKNNIVTKSPNIIWRNPNNAKSIAENRTGDIIVGTRYGAYILKDKKVSLLRKRDGLANDYVNSLLVTNDSSIIYGSHGSGLTIYKNGEYRYLTTEDGLSNGIINILYQKTDGAIWIGTDNGGVNIWKDNTIDTIDVAMGLTSNRIHDITEDDNGKMYISTPNGVNIIEHYADEIFIRTLTKDDGLVANNCTLNGTFKDKDGIFWIGTGNGVSKYNPSKDKVISTPPKIYVTGVEIFNEKYPIKKLKSEKELDHNQNYIKFIYTGINLSAPKKILFKYRLVGIDKDWVETKRDWAQYTNLDAGEYSFEVKARNEWNFWSKEAILNFTIKPIWWKTWWFRVVAVSIFLFGMYFTVSRRISKLEKERKAEEGFSKRLLQSEEKERERIASGLHDSLGQNLLVIKNRALLGLKSKKVEAPIEQLSEISDAATLAIDEVRQIAYNLHPYQLNRLGLTKAIKSKITNIKESTAIIFEEKIDSIDGLFNKEEEIHIYRIFQEITNNVVKHSEATEVVVRITKLENNIIVNIKDNGKGFNKNLVNNKKEVGGFGFQNINKRVSLLNGTIRIHSKYGTEINIEIPITRNTD
ncbi:MAG: two-component regulator propeller domain-containing protein [Melioribacteraceae bacterium]